MKNDSEYIEQINLEATVVYTVNLTSGWNIGFE